MSGGPNLRQRQREQTQSMIQAEAIRLFCEHGFDATTVNDVAAAAGVSPMTVYRHFPTKEDLVLFDRYDPLIAATVAKRPADEPLVRRIGVTLVEAVRAVTDGHGPGGPGDRELLYARLRLMADTPALRARHLDRQLATQQAIVAALLGDAPDPDEEFRAWVVAGACYTALSIAMMRWAREDGMSDLPGLVAEALRAAFGGDFA